MSPIVSVITPASRGVKELRNLINDFNNQTLKSLKGSFEHILVHDGPPPADVQEFMDRILKKGLYDLKFTSISKDTGNMTVVPGTRPRNHGVSLTTGEYCVFCDDDDRYNSRYLERLVEGLDGDTINVVQMACAESRIYTNGNPDRICAVPEIGLPMFPMCGHVGTPCFILKRSWVVDLPWLDEPEHDYRLLKRICLKYNPKIRIIPEIMVDVDGYIRGMKDWVSMAPFYREEI